MLGHVKNVRKQPNHQYIGSGRNAYVGQTNTPHEMDNVSRISQRVDGGSIFLQYIATHPELHNNPFFPRVLGTTDNGEVAAYKVEKLYPLTTPKIVNNKEFLLSLWDIYYNDPLPEEDVAKMDGERIAHIFVDRMAANLYGSELTHIRLSALKHAVKIISQIIEQTPNAEPDMYEGNVMWRMTGNMPQLVITDPISIAT